MVFYSSGYARVLVGCALHHLCCQTGYRFRNAQSSSCCLLAGDAAKSRADGHANTCGVAFAQNIACHHLASHKQVGTWLMVETDRRGVIGFQTEVSEGDAGLHGISIERGCIKRQISLRSIGSAVRPPCLSLSNMISACKGSEPFQAKKALV